MIFVRSRSRSCPSLPSEAQDTVMAAVQADEIQGCKHLSTGGARGNERGRTDRSVGHAGACPR